MGVEEAEEESTDSSSAPTLSLSQDLEPSSFNSNTFGVQFNRDLLDKNISDIRIMETPAFRAKKRGGGGGGWATARKGMEQGPSAVPGRHRRQDHLGHALS